jgi:hypothetical protein
VRVPGSRVLRQPGAVKQPLHRSQGLARGQTLPYLERLGQRLADRAGRVERAANPAW